ncbi:MAG: zinc ABC transporter substrate-binding protein [Saprospiraceae bacterium]|nr:zinc ABC transporter substrate-binding protein [Saprospiraceae bacterium]
MKIHLTLLFSCWIAFSAMASKPVVLATASMWADMAKVIGGELIEVEMIVPVGSDPHLYEPTPGDLRKVHRADLILINGLTFEGWLEKLIQSSESKAFRKILTEGIVPITNPHFKNSTDPHAWMDPINGKTYANNLATALIAIDSLHEKEYRFNLNIYLQELDDLHNYISSRVLEIPMEHRVLITSHDAFHYFGNRYGLEVESLLGTSTDADVQTGDFLRVNQLIKNQKIPAIFIESTINPKLMEQISKENKVKIGGKLFADSLGDEGTMADTYIGMLRSNAEIIFNALSQREGTTELDTNHHKSNWSFDSSNYYFFIPLFLLLILAVYFLLKRMRSI